MPTQDKLRYSEPVWWTVQHTVIWEQQLPTLRRDFQQQTGANSRAHIASQGPDNSVFQKTPGTPRNVPVERAHKVPDTNWEVGTAWEQVAPGMRYGVGARAQYPQYHSWNDELEALLRKDWSETNEPSTWEKVKRAVRHGFESLHKKAN
jgi:hypothetical protein